MTRWRGFGWLALLLGVAVIWCINRDATPLLQAARTAAAWKQAVAAGGGEDPTCGALLWDVGLVIPGYGLLIGLMLWRARPPARRLAAALVSALVLVDLCENVASGWLLAHSASLTDEQVSRVFAVTAAKWLAFGGVGAVVAGWAARGRLDFGGRGRQRAGVAAGAVMAVCGAGWYFWPMLSAGVMAALLLLLALDAGAARITPSSGRRPTGTR